MNYRKYSYYYFKFYLLALFILHNGSASAQYSPTFWPNAHGVSLNFKTEPPTIDTSSFPLPNGAGELIGTSLTDRKGIQRGVFVEYGTSPNPQLLNLYFTDYNYTPKVGMIKGLMRSAGGFISFNDSTHYLYTNLQAGTFDTTSLYSFFTANDNRINHAFFYKINLQNDTITAIENSFELIKPINNSTYRLSIISGDSIIWCESGMKFIRRRNQVYAIFSAAKYYSPDRLLNRSVDVGILVCKLNADLQIEKANYVKLISQNVKNTFDTLTVINLMLVNNQHTRLYYCYNDCSTKDRAKLEYIEFNDQMDVVSSKYLTDISNYYCLEISSPSNTFTQKFYSVAISPNDSFMYYWDIHPPGFRYDKFDSLIQLNVFDGSKYFYPITDYAIDIYRGVGLFAPNINNAPNGKIYINVATKKNTSDKISVFTIIDQPNRHGQSAKLYNSNYFVDSNVFVSRRFRINMINPNNNFNLYARLDSIDCRGMIFYQNCDTVYDQLIWFFSGMDSVVLAPSQPRVLYKYPKLGTYLMKIKGITPSGYFNYYSDSINTYEQCYISPNFYSQDSIGCQWVEQTFYDSSCLHVQQPQPGERRWIWNFGDGKIDTTYVPVIKHVFTNSGTFNVSMTLQFGNCNETIIKTSVIKILPAPKPGFALLRDTICLPASVSIIDTTQTLVFQKLYRFATTLADTIIPVGQSSINYTYAIPGRYVIKQTLISINGCVTSDTAVVWVFNSANNSRPTSPYINVVSNTSLNIFWNRDSATKYYLLYRTMNYGDPQLLVSQTDTQYTDTRDINAQRNIYRYAIQYNDWCDNRSELSEYDNNILLTSFVLPNKRCDVQFVQNAAQKFTLIKLFDSDTVLKLPLIKNLYSDNDYYNDSQTQTCYRITGEKDGFVLYSNYGCETYKASLFIPSLFDYYRIGNALPIYATYLKRYTIAIYDVRGRKVYEADNPVYWQSAPDASGLYYYTATGTTRNDEPFSQVGKILLIK